MSNKKILSLGAKASIAYLIANVVNKSLSYITTPIFTRMMTPEEYGQVSVFITWMSIIGIVSMYCLCYGVFNNGMMDYSEDRDRFTFSLLILSNVITIICGVFMIVFQKQISNLLGISLPLILLMIGVFLTQPAYGFWSARQRYEYKYKNSSVLSVVSAIISPFAAILFIYLFPQNKVLSRIFAGESVLLIIYIVLYIYIAIKAKGKIQLSYWKYALIFNAPLIPHYLSTYLLNGADKIMIAELVSDSSAAFYNVAYSVAAVVTILWTSVNASLIPFTYERCKKKDYRAISNVTQPLVTVFAVACVFVIMLAPEVVSIMATREYLEAIYVIPPIVGGVFFQTQYYIYSTVVYYHKKAYFVMIASVTATVLNVVLNYIFIPLFGYFAAGYTTLFCYIVQAFIDYIAMRKIVGQSIYNMKYMTALSAMIVIISLGSNALYKYPIIRYFIMALMIILAVIFRKTLMSTLSIIRIKKSDTSENLGVDASQSN